MKYFYLADSILALLAMIGFGIQADITLDATYGIIATVYGIAFLPLFGLYLSEK